MRFDVSVYVEVCSMRDTRFGVAIQNNISAVGWEKNSDENGLNRYVCT